MRLRFESCVRLCAVSALCVESAFKTSPLCCRCVLTCLFSPLCVLTVTLLDSMSALADLGWEAYPNEGVSTAARHKQKPSSLCAGSGANTVNLVLTSGSVHMFYFRVPGWDWRLQQHWCVCVCFRSAECSWLNRDAAGRINKLFPPCCKSCTGTSIYNGAMIFGMERKGGWRAGCTYIRGGC